MELGDLCDDYAEYRFTNESLEAVMAGLKVSEGDRIFAVLGAGDQALAMIEKADYVLAIDKDKLQAVYARKIRHLIKTQTESVRKELESKMSGAGTFYFLKGKRLDRIKSRISHLQIEQRNMYRLPKHGRFSKAYLSNAIRYSSYPSSEKIFEYLSALGERLEKPGLIYLTRYNYLECRVPGARVVDKCYSSKLSEPQGLVIDKRLTEKAYSFECGGPWHPIVLRKA